MLSHCVEAPHLLGRDILVAILDPLAHGVSVIEPHVSCVVMARSSWHSDAPVIAVLMLAEIKAKYPAPDPDCGSTCAPPPPVRVGPGSFSCGTDVHLLRPPARRRDRLAPLGQEMPSS